MRPAEFTPESIIEAGNELQARGRNITGFALRQKVGGGNPSRLKQVWDEHLASRSVTKAEPVAELPVEVAEEVAAVTKALTERLAALAIELNDKAVKAAERRVHEVVRSAGEQRAQAERELADAAQTVEDLEDKLDEVTGHANVLNGKLAEAHGTSQAQAVELAQLRERLTVTEQTAKTAEVQHIQALKTLADQHAAELARLNAGIEGDRSRHLQEIEQIRVELAQQKQATQATATERDQVRAELMALRVKAEAADQTYQEQRVSAAQEARLMAERMAKVAADRDTARKEAAAAREEAAKLNGQIEAMQTQATELVRALSERKDTPSTPASPL